MEHINLPSSTEIEAELMRERYKRRYKTTLRSTIFALVTASAAAVLVATLFLPVLQIFGSSMNPTLEEGQIVVSVKAKELQAGDIVAFYYGNRVLIKRYIAGPGTWIDIDEAGNVYLNDHPLNEPYLTEKAFTSVFTYPDGGGHTEYWIGNTHIGGIDSSGTPYGSTHGSYTGTAAEGTPGKG